MNPLRPIKDEINQGIVDNMTKNIDFDKPGEFILVRDLIAEKLDELADIGEYWKRNREKDYTPNAIRAAMLMLIDEIKLLQKTEGKTP